MWAPFSGHGERRPVFDQRYPCWACSSQVLHKRALWYPIAQTPGSRCALGQVLPEGSSSQRGLRGCLLLATRLRKGKSGAVHIPGFSGFCNEQDCHSVFALGPTEEDPVPSWPVTFTALPAKPRPPEPALQTWSSHPKTIAGAPVRRCALRFRPSSLRCLRPGFSF